MLQLFKTVTNLVFWYWVVQVQWLFLSSAAAGKGNADQKNEPIRLQKTKQNNELKDTTNMRETAAELQVLH